MGVNYICTEGTLSPKTGNTTIGWNKKSKNATNDIYLYGNNCTLYNYTLVAVSSSFSTFHVEFQRNLIVLRDSILYLEKCELIDTLVTNDDILMQGSPVEILMTNSKLNCQNDYKSGFIFDGSIVLSLIIRNSQLINCRVDLQVQGISMEISNSVIQNSTLNVKATSLLSVLSIINIKDSLFTRSGRSMPPTGGLSLALFNTVVQLANCSFFNMPIELISEKLHYVKQVFFLNVSDSVFSHSVKLGDGGSLMTISRAESSEIHLINSQFIENSAIKQDSIHPGLGGAVYIDGQSVNVSIIQCNFDNNVASESGTSLYISEGVSLNITNSFFSYTIRETDHSLPPLLKINGEIFTLNAEIKLVNPVRKLHNIKVDMISMTLTYNIDILMQCPSWYIHGLDYKRHSNTIIRNYLKSVSYSCAPCIESYFYSLPESKRIIFIGHDVLWMTNGTDQTTDMESCNPCPFGAVCSGNDVVPRPNYYGYWHKGELRFQLCPKGYCCSGTKQAPCTKFDYCAMNRTGVLCGACQEGFSMSILNGVCIANSQCGQDYYFWFLAILAPLGYALWYSFKDDIFRLLLSLLSINIRSKQTKEKSHDSNNEADVCSSKLEMEVSNFSEFEGLKRRRFLGDSKDEFDDISQEKITNEGVKHVQELAKTSGVICNDNAQDNGYFGIVAFFVQISAVIKITIEFSDIDKSKSVVDYLEDYIDRAVNFQVSKISLNICPISGLNMKGKHMYSLLFPYSVFLAWLVLYTITYIVKHSIKTASYPKALKRIDQVQLNCDWLMASQKL